MGKQIVIKVSPTESVSWQAMRRALSAKSKTQLLNLIRDLYALNSENRDVVQTHVRAPKTPPRRNVRVGDMTSGATPKSKPSQIARKIRGLAQIAATLREGGSFTITRLTTLKSLCEDADATAQFALHLAKLTYRKMQAQEKPAHLDVETWAYYRQMVDEAIRQMERYRANPTEDEADLARAWWSNLHALQSEHKRQAWGSVRIIASTEVLLVEQALSCLLQPTASADWGYRIARQYAERYHGRYGTGLIPASAPMVEDIADFWCQYYMGKPLQEWLETA